MCPLRMTMCTVVFALAMRTRELQSCRQQLGERWREVEDEMAILEREDDGDVMLLRAPSTTQPALTFVSLVAIIPETST